ARTASAALGRERARHAGALTLDASEPEFSFDGEGNVVGVEARTQTESHRLIEHLMIAANEAVAGHLAERGVPCLYRVHERPEVERVERLIEQLASLEVPTPPVPRGMSRTRAGELMGEISRLVERHVRGVARRAREGDPRAAPSGGRVGLTSLVLRSLQQAYYSPKNLGHAGLGSGCYCHFTSPIRRYPDIVCHRALLSTLGGAEPAPRSSGLVDLGVWTSEREREAMVIERDCDDVARCFALEGLLYGEGWERTFPGEVTGLISAGAFVAFGPEPAGEEATAPTPPYEGMLPVRRLRASEPQGSPRAGSAPRGAGARREWWELNEEGTILYGERSGAGLRIGGPVEVRVRRVEALRGRVDLELAGDEG
ncbi:MAG TPA: RNB domain-containing ribonuclease, partial [Solirubrobacteraceae bacterium]|nr:RNB domain-containing ribonuclease [Solirubrobacteraceae bacterium]